MVLEILGVLFVWSWPIWSFVFIFRQISALKNAEQAQEDIDKNPALWPGVWASVSLSVILGGMVSLIILATR